MQISSVSTSRASSDIRSRINSEKALGAKRNIKEVIEKVADKEVRKLYKPSSEQSSEKIDTMIDAVIQHIMNTLDKKTEGVSMMDKLSVELSEPGGLSSSLMASLQPDAMGEVNEEEMQFGIVKFLLEEQSPEAAEVFSSTVSQSIDNGVGIEDAVNLGLSEVVEQGIIEPSSAEMINGISFQAAQLDSDHTALFDSTGGVGDNTVATMNMESAIDKAQAMLEQIESGEVSIQARSLDEVSNVAPGATGFAENSAGTHNGSSLAGFLWKPASESDGRLVVLLPQALTGNVTNAGIYSSLPPTEANKIEEGRFSGDTHNGGRAHFRFSQSGGAYPDGSYIVAELRGGEKVTFKIGDSSSRNT